MEAHFSLQRVFVCLRALFSRSLSSKSNYRVILDVNMNIADSISSYFNFGRGYHFVLRVKQQIFDRARIFFVINNLKHAIANWRENNRNLLAPFAIILKLSRQDIICKLTHSPRHHDCIKHSKAKTRNSFKNTNTLKCYSSDELAGGF